MKNLFLFTVLLLFISCGSKPDFTKLTEGMTTTEVIKTVGEPDEKADILGVEFWTYHKSGYLLSVENGRLSGVTTPEELNEIGEGVVEALDSLDLYFNPE